MNKPEISIILPSIRKENLDKFYDSILSSTKRQFELIVCGPYSLTDKLQNQNNVKYIKDMGSPSRCSNIAATLAEGKFITWGTDDSLYLPNAFDKVIDELIAMGSFYKNVVISKYLEGPDGAQKVVQPDNYYKVNGAPCTASQFISNDWWIFNTAIMHRSFFEELGGLDCEFEHAAMADTDLCIRAYAVNAIVKMVDVLLYDASHGHQDHKPIEIAQITHDEPLLHSRYRNPEWVMREMRIELDNWKKVSSIWNRRF